MAKNAVAFLVINWQMNNVFRLFCDLNHSRSESMSSFGNIRFSFQGKVIKFYLISPAPRGFNRSQKRERRV